MSQESIFQEILSERKRQDLVFGKEQNHSPERWVSVLAQQVGAAAKQANRFHSPRGSELNLQKYEIEAIQVAAVAFAALECLERGEWRIEKNEQDKERSQET